MTEIYYIPLKVNFEFFEILKKQFIQDNKTFIQQEDIFSRFMGLYTIAKVKGNNEIEIVCNNLKEFFETWEQAKYHCNFLNK